MRESPPGRFVCNYGHEVITFISTMGVWCREGHPATFDRALTRAEVAEGADGSDNGTNRDDVAEGVKMPRGQRTPEPDEKAAAKALKLLQGGSTRKQTVEETGLTTHQVWRIQRSNDLLKKRSA